MTETLLPKTKISEQMFGGYPNKNERVSKNSSSYFVELRELRNEVTKNGCLARGTQDICSACGRLALEVPMCRQIKERKDNGTINVNE